MRKGLISGGVLALINAIAPAQAQYGAPFNPGFFTTPEYTSGALGAGAAMGAAQHQSCNAPAGGRDGWRGGCQPDPTPPPPAGKK